MQVATYVAPTKSVGPDNEVDTTDSPTRRPGRVVRTVAMDGHGSESGMDARPSGGVPPGQGGARPKPRNHTLFYPVIPQLTGSKNLSPPV